MLFSFLISLTVFLNSQFKFYAHFFAVFSLTLKSNGGILQLAERNLRFSAFNYFSLTECCCSYIILSTEIIYASKCSHSFLLWVNIRISAVGFMVYFQALPECRHVTSSSIGLHIKYFQLCPSSQLSSVCLPSAVFSSVQQLLSAD